MKAKWHCQPYKDYGIKKWLLTFEVEDTPEIYDDTKDKELTLKISTYHKKRSLDANAYCWVLCTKLSEVLGTSKDEVYEEMLLRYGTMDEDDDGEPIVVSLLSRIPVEKLGGHWKYMSSSMQFNTYLKIKGSSEMNSKEMAKLIDGIVSECKDFGIETATPDELERMAQQWGV